METFWQDVKHGLRLLARNPGFSLAAVLTLALGVGANTTVFNVINAVILNPLPYRDPGSIVFVWKQNPKVNFLWSTTTREQVELLRTESKTLDSVAIYGQKSLTLTSADGGPEQVSSAEVSPNLFAFLGVQPRHGRAFTEEDTLPGATHAVILGHGLWSRRFGGDRGIIGKTVTLDSTPYTVLGVMPPRFEFPPDVDDLWLPLPADPKTTTLFAIGRIAPGVRLAQAQAEMDTLSPRLPVERPSDRDWSIRLMTTSDLLGTQLTTALWVLFAAVGLVLLIACANIANLLLARAAVRQRELAIRAALGAGPWRLARQSLTESLLIAVFGGSLGLLFSLWGTDFVVRFRPQALSELQRVHVDGWTLAFALAIALVTALVFGLAPALRIAGRNLRQALTESGANQATGRRQNLLGRSLVTTEVALSVVLLAGAGLLVHSFVRLINSDPGFDPRGLLVAEFSLNDQRYPDPAARTAFFQRLGESLEGIPGVESVALTTGIPPRLGIMAGQLAIEGRELSEADRNLTLPAATVAPDFFRTAGIPILRGRTFTAEDTADVVVMNQGMAERYWPGEDAVGKTFTFGRSDRPRTIVGVAGNVDAMGWGNKSARFQMYFPQARWPYGFGAMAIRTRPGVSGLGEAIKQRVWAIDPLIPVDKIQTAEQMLAASISRQRFAMILLSIFATLAIALSAVGLYGVVSYMVEQRTREIGIRMALGARPVNIFRMVLGEGAWSLAAGWGIGIALSLVATDTLRRLLFEVSPTDPLTLGAVSVLLSVVALLACYFPARRATRVDPIIALRME